MMTIHLHELSFFARHGVHEEERILGNDFMVNADVQYATPATVIQTLEETIDYVVLYDLIHARMQEPTPLLETVAMEMAAAMKQRFPRIRHLLIEIYKVAAPVENFQGRLGIRYEQDYD
jgi:7,8-dihydroneopterin aldolase/epimerase/oxygenase